MKVMAVKCPKCETPSKMNGNDLLFLCESCGTLHYVDEGRIEAVEYGVVKSDSETDKTQYLPVWNLEVKFSAVTSTQSFWNAYDKSAPKLMNIYLPAWNTDPAEFRRWAINLTTGKWKYNLGGEIGIRRRVPARMNLEQAHEMADFVVVTIEAEKPGTMQYLDYNLEIIGASVLYIPQNP